jgi:hypothetical protein
MMALAYNPHIAKVKARRLQAQGWYGLYTKILS